MSTLIVRYIDVRDGIRLDKNIIFILESKTKGNWQQREERNLYNRSYISNIKFCFKLNWSQFTPLYSIMLV